MTVSTTMRRRFAIKSRPRATAFAAALACAFLAALGAPSSASAEERPLHLVVSLADQNLSVYRGAALVETVPVSTGRPGFATPTGVFTVLERRRWHRSNIYSDAPMPFMQRLTWSGIALHAGALPGYPASHGCVRLPDAKAEALFGLSRRGDHVTIVAGDARPVPFAHPALPRPPEEAPLAADAAPEPARYAAASLTDVAMDAAIDEPPEEEASRSPLRILLTLREPPNPVAEAQRLLAALGHDPGPVDGFMGPATARAIAAFEGEAGASARRGVSPALLARLRAAAGEPEPSAGVIYVRRDFRPLFEAPVALSDPDAALGTHLLLFEGLDAASGEALWTATRADAAVDLDPGAALSRFSLPADLRDRIARSLRPGSSIVVTDRGFGRDSGRLGGDFITLTTPR